MRADVCVLCFSVGSPPSFMSVMHDWYPEMDALWPEVPFVLVGLQKELRYDTDTLHECAQNGVSPVHPTDGEQLAEEIGASAYRECSSLTSPADVIEVFETAIRCAGQPRPAKPEEPPRRLCSVS